MNITSSFLHIEEINCELSLEDFIWEFSPKYIHVISTGYNCEFLARECYESIASQNTNYKIFWWVWNDASSDGTQNILEKIQLINEKYGSPIHISVYNSIRNVGAAMARWELLMNVQKSNQSGIVVQLDLDDYLAHNQVFQTIMSHYEHGIKMTCGHYREGEKPIGHIRHYSDTEIAQKSYLRPIVPFCVPPLRTFRTTLINNLLEDNFKWDGKWIKYCTDAALMYSVLVQLQPHEVKRLTDILYHYRQRDGRVPKPDARAKKRMLENIKGKFRKCTAMTNVTKPL